MNLYPSLILWLGLIGAAFSFCGFGAAALDGLRPIFKAGIDAGPPLIGVTFFGVTGCIVAILVLVLAQWASRI